MAVPARHKRRGESSHRLRFDDQILEQLVQRGAHMDIAIRERRPVVENEFRSILGAAAGKDFLIQPHIFPPLEAGGFVLHQITAHREIRLRKGQGVFVIRGSAHDGAQTLAMRSSGVNHGKHS